MLSFMLSVAFFIVILSVHNDLMLSVVMLNIIMLGVIMLSVIYAKCQLCFIAMQSVVMLSDIQHHYAKQHSASLC
jgi:hypothetical protein